VVVQVLVAERNAEHALADQGADVVNDPVRCPAIRKAGSESVDQIDRLVGRAQQQRPGVLRDRATAKIRHQIAAIEACETHGLRVTLCQHRGLR
jgi:hypothetical protein